MESEPTNAETWGKRVLTSLACLYARAHSLPECGLLADALDVPDDFDVTDTQYREVFSRLSHLFGAQDSYWCYFDPTEPPDAKEEPVFGLLPDDLADIYRDVAPGVRCWDSQRDEFLHSIIFRWSWPLFHTHWGCHAVSAMRALHELVYARGFQPSA